MNRAFWLSLLNNCRQLYFQLGDVHKFNTWAFIFTVILRFKPEVVLITMCKLASDAELKVDERGAPDSWKLADIALPGNVIR